MKERLYASYGRLPRWLRRFVIRRIGPSYQVGAACVIRRANGDVLLVRNSYRTGWGLPGGLLRRREAAEAGARREVREEVGLDVVIDSVARVAVTPDVRRIDVVFTAHVPPGQESAAAPTSPEIVEVGWFAVGCLPALQTEMTPLLTLVGVPIS